MRHHTTTRTLLRSLGTIGGAAALVLAISPWAQAARADTSPTPDATATSAAETATPTLTAAGSVTSTPTATATSPVSPTAVESSSSATPASAPSPAAPGSTASTTPSGTALRSRATTGNAPAGAAYLVKQLTGGDHVESSYSGKSYADYGSTADVAIALASTGTQDATLAKVLAYLDAHVTDYADPAGAQGGPFDGAGGKLALVTEIVGGDPHGVDGTDLISLLVSTVCTAATKDGACSAAGDFHGAYSGLGQALPILALARAGAAVPPAALTRLGQLQCSDGGFSSDLVAPGATCTSEADTTGVALQALVLLPSESAVAQKAAAFLLARQQSDGGFIGAAGENANSTALAVQGLIAGGASDSVVTKGLSFLASLQQTDGGLKVNAAGTASDLLATDQSVPALARTTLTTLTHTVAAGPAPTTTPTPTTSTTASPAASPTTTASTGASGGTTGSTMTTGATGALPYTGSDAAWWARIAAALLLAGFALVGVAWRLRFRGRRAR